MRGLLENRLGDPGRHRTQKQGEISGAGEGCTEAAGTGESRAAMVWNGENQSRAVRAGEALNGGTGTGKVLAGEVRSMAAGNREAGT